MANTNYDNRKIDLLVFHVDDYSESPKTVRLGLFSDPVGNSQICTGIVKLAQKVGILMLTHAHYHDRLWGTAFAEIVFAPGVNLTVTKEKFESSFANFAADIVELLTQQIEQNDSSSPIDRRNDEIIGRVDLDTIDIDRELGSLTINVLVTSISGETVTLVLPMANELLTG